MTKTEKEKCIKLMQETIRYAKTAYELLNEDCNKNKVQAHNYLGYAEGINQALVTIGFKNEKMKELEELLP